MAASACRSETDTLQRRALSFDQRIGSLTARIWAAHSTAASGRITVAQPNPDGRFTEDQRSIDMFCEFTERFVRWRSHQDEDLALDGGWIHAIQLFVDPLEVEFHPIQILRRHRLQIAVTSLGIDAELDLHVDQGAVERGPHFLQDVEHGGRNGLHHLQLRLADDLAADHETRRQDLVVGVHRVVLGIILSGFLFDRSESGAFLDCRIAFEEGSGCDASADPFDGHHGAFAAVKRSFVTLFDEMSFQADRLQQAEDFRRRLIGNLSLADHFVSPDAISSGDAILGDDDHSAGIVCHAVNSLRFAFGQQFTLLRRKIAFWASPTLPANGLATSCRLSTRLERHLSRIGLPESSDGQVLSDEGRICRTHSTAN